MPRYINADELQSQITRKSYRVAQERYREGFNDAILRVKSMIHRAPTADVQEAKHGKWIENGCAVECSCCGNEVFMNAKDESAEYSKRVNYCFNCGAKMED